MKRKYGTKESAGIKICDSKKCSVMMITVEDVLEEALECAERVHNKKQKMPKEEEENAKKSEPWMNLDNIFKSELLKICESKAVKMVNKTVGEIGAETNVNASDNAEH
jgi:hypothetical protein